jgi:hypothetical protein
MKFASLARATAATLALLQLAAAAVGAAPSTTILSMAEALEAAKDTTVPAGVTLTGSVEPLKQPPATKTKKKEKESAATTAINDADEAAIDTPSVRVRGSVTAEHQEWLGPLGGHGWGNWGGWGGLGPYRFGYSCGGLGGWAYPLGYWNTFGAGLYGGACGLGMACGGLYYC